MSESDKHHSQPFDMTPEEWREYTEMLDNITSHLTGEEKECCAFAASTLNDFVLQLAQKLLLKEFKAQVVNTSVATALAMQLASSEFLDKLFNLDGSRK
jgi:hypothetical protein